MRADGVEPQVEQRVTTLMEAPFAHSQSNAERRCQHVQLGPQHFHGVLELLETLLQVNGATALERDAIEGMQGKALVVRCERHELGTPSPVSSGI